MRAYAVPELGLCKTWEMVSQLKQRLGGAAGTRGQRKGGRSGETGTYAQSTTPGGTRFQFQLRQWRIRACRTAPRATATRTPGRGREERKRRSARSLLLPPLSSRRRGTYVGRESSEPDESRDELEGRERLGVVRTGGSVLVERGRRRSDHHEGRGPHHGERGGPHPGDLGRSHAVEKRRGGSAWCVASERGRKEGERRTWREEEG